MRKVSDSAIGRLSSYFRVLEELELQETRTVSSKVLAERSGVTPAQVRKDLCYFGNFGRRGLGYDVVSLKNEIRQILGLTKKWRVALIGAGNIGSALFSYKEFRKQGFEIVAIFDKSAERIGEKWGGLSIFPIDELQRESERLQIEIAVIATPARAAQDVADMLAKTNVKGILNFAPTKLFVPEGVVLRNVNMAIELEGLSFSLKHMQGQAGKRRGKGRAAGARGGEN